MRDLGFIHHFQRGSERGGSTLLLLHGTGGDESDLLPLGRDLLPGANLLSPRGKVLEQGMPRFFRRLAEGLFDVPDLVARTHELARFVRGAVDAYGLDASRMFAVGFSNGANIAASMLLLHPGLLRGAVLLRPMVPFEPEQPPALEGTAVLIVGGRMDPIVPPAQTERLAEILRTLGAAVTVQWQASGHALSQGDVDVSRSWLARESHAVRTGGAE